jgi:GGDEF domain-containing protein
MLAEAKLEVRQRGDRDAVTGLPTAKVMGRALQALNEAGCSSAILVARLWPAAPETVDAAAINAALRSMSGALQANVRQGDVVCRLDDLTFAAVMPGLERDLNEQPIARILAAINGILQSHRAEGRDIRLAIGTGYWLPPMNPAEPFEQAWHAMLSNRRAQDPGSPLR